MDYRNDTPDPDSPYALTDTKTVIITVRPKQDDPTIPTVPGEQEVDEDQVLELPAFQVLDVDVRSHLESTGETVVYDPDWEGTVTITVLYGTVWLQDPDGVEYTGNRTREISLTGGLDDLNLALRDGNVRYQGDPDFNSRNRLDDPTDDVPHDTLTITIHDLGNTDILNRDGDDGTGVLPRTTSDTVMIVVNPKQDAPTIPTIPGDQQVDEDTPLALPAFEVFDVDARSSLVVDDTTMFYDPDWVGMVNITVVNGFLWLDDSSGVVYDGDRTDQITLVGSLDALNEALREGNVIYQGNPNVNSGNEAADNITPDVLTIVISDLGNTDIDDVPPLTNEDHGDIDQRNRTVLITVLPVNDPPVFVHLPGPQTVHEAQTEGLSLNEDERLVFSELNSNAIVVDDPDVLEHPDGQLQVTLSVNNGTLTLFTVDDLTFLNEDNDPIDASDVLQTGISHITMFGTPDAVNSALEGMTYQGFLHYNGPDQLVIVVNDQGFTGATGPREIQATIDITVIVVNSAPEITLPDDPSWGLGFEDTNLLLPGIVVGDPDEEDGSVTLEVTLQVTQGTLTVNTNVQGGINTVSGNNTGTVVLIGKPTQINQTLAHPSSVIYLGKQNYNDFSLAPKGTPNEVLVVTVNDRGNVGIGGPQLVTESVTISILPVNDPPSIQSTQQKNLLEDAADAYIPITVTDVDADENPADPLAAVTVTLRLTNTQGQPLTTAGTLAVLDNVDGGIIPDVNGRILGNGTAVLTISGSPEAITKSFAATNGVHYLPAENFSGSLRLVATVEDHGNTDYREDAASLSHTVTVTINVTAENDPPIALPQTVETIEDQPVAITLTGDDGDPEVVQVLTFALVDGPSFGTVTGFHPATGQVTYTPDPDFAGTDTFTFTVTDDAQAGQPANLTSEPATVTITVTPVNQPLPARRPRWRSRSIPSTSRRWRIPRP